MVDATAADNIPTMTVRPDDRPAATQAPEKLAAPPTDKPTAPTKRLSFTDMVKQWKALGYSDAGASGIADNMIRESQGDPTAVGDQGTSRGLFQEHAGRKAELEAFAKEHGTSPDDPHTQIAFADQELRTKFPKLRERLINTDDRSDAEKNFRTTFERPASVMWAHGPDGQPITGAGKFHVSDYAMADAKRRHGDDSLYFMSPGEYLDLSPALEGKPFDSASGRSLMRSVNRGDQIDEIPSLETKVDGPTATVTDQDGRHRALLAQREGVEAMPVAIRQQGEGSPTEIVGQSGNIMAHDFPKVAGYQAAPRPQSMFGKMAQALMPSAEAAEPDPWAAFRGGAQPAAEQPAQDQADPWAAFRGGAQPQQQAQQPTDNSFMGGVKSGLGAYPAVAAGLVRGIGNAVYEGEKLVGRGMQAVGIPGGATVAGNASQNQAQVEKDTAPYVEGHPVAAGIGNFTGSMIPPALIGGGIGDLIGAGAGVVAALQGGLSGLLTPGGDENFWRDKALGGGFGAAFGGLTGKVGNVLSNFVRGDFRAAVNKLLGEGVELTPGQMAGGRAKRIEDWFASHPIFGSQVLKQQRRSIETFNRAAINRSLDDIGTKLPQGLVSGHDAIGFAQDAFTQAYDSVIPRMVGQVDTGLRSDLGDILTKAQRENLPQEYQDRLRHVLENEIRDPFVQAGGSLPGDAVQKMGTQLDALITPMRISDNPYVQQMARYLREADKAIDGMMARQNPVLQAAKDRIDAGYAKFKTVQAASKAVGTHPDGTFTPAQLNRAVATRDRSKDKAAFARGDALMQDLAIAARDVLPQTVPNSGTAERLAFLSMLGGGSAGLGYLEPGSLLAATVFAAPYTAPGSKAVNMAANKLMQQSIPGQNALANMLRLGGQVAGPTGGLGAAAVLTPRPQPPQPGQQ